MKWPVALTASILIAGQAVSAGLVGDIVHGVRRDDATDRGMRRRAASIVNAEDLDKRAAVAGSTTLNDAQTVAACTTALMSVPANSINPSGMAVCYNLPTLDSTTGAFQADMRLFRVATATGQFAGLSDQGVQVGLSYSGASVQPTNSSVNRREVYSLISWPATKRDGVESRATTPVLTQTYAFTGQINKAIMTSNMTDAQFEAAVLPTVTLTAMSAANVPVFNTTLNSTQAAFVVGAFSGKAATTGASSATTGASAATTTSGAAISTSTVFILPGTKILIFPIGAIITGTWTLLGVATVMYGTFGRIQFRDQYRRQAARQAAGNIARI